ncbi:MAG: hypothetical protein JNL70_22075 [Saprospiraceae bacterium]|nr:hypothetical protein [Saprospiraceae bacterium]
MFITETIIDAVVGELESTDFEYEIAVFSKQYPVLIEYWGAEDFALLTQDERELMLYLMLVLVKSVEKAKAKLPPLSHKALENAEETNWERLDNVTAKRFRDRMDVFFDNYAQEDLLAFVEDNLVEDDDSVVTKEGREPIFVALKSVIDIIA